MRQSSHGISWKSYQACRFSVRSKRLRTNAVDRITGEKIAGATEADEALAPHLHGAPFRSRLGIVSIETEGVASGSEKALVRIGLEQPYVVFHGFYETVQLAGQYLPGDTKGIALDGM